MMMETTMSRSLRLVFAGGAALGIGMLAQPAMAQTADTTTAAPVQRVEITGSSIRRVDSETPSPVQVISAEELKKSGFTSVADVLSNLTANGQGTLSNGFAGAFAAGATAVSLRGLNSSATLILIDGHRMAPNALSDDGQRSFVDTSNLPFDAIDRIEILKDGASAVYGSDAMAGVINFILKKNYVGTTVNAEGGTSQEGGGTTLHASIISGIGDLEEDGYNLYGSIEARSSADITAASRMNASSQGGWTTRDWSGFGGQTFNDGTINPSTTGTFPAVHGVYLVTQNYLQNTQGANLFGPQAAANTAFLGGGSCTSLGQLQGGGCAYFPPAELEPKTDNLNILVSFNKRLSDGWKLNTKASFFNSATDVTPSNTGYPGNAGPLVGLSASNPIPTLVGNTIPSVTVPANYPGNTTGQAAYIFGLSPNVLTQDQVNSKTYRLAADLDGSIGEWDISASGGYSKNSIRQTIIGSMNVPNFNAAINRCANADASSGCTPFNLVGPNSAADMASVYPTIGAVDTSTLAYLEVHAGRPIMPLPGGDLALSTGATYIYRDMQSPAPAAVGNGIISGNNAYVSGSQTDGALYAEIAAPVLKSLEVDGAARFDHFDTAGGTNAGTGKLGFKFTPTSVIGLRGTYSTGFRAPNPAEAGNAGLSYLGIPYDSTLCPGGGAAVANSAPAAGSVVGACTTQVYLQTASKDLSPEKSTAETLGLILEPVKGWSSTIDLYQIKIKDQIVSGPAGNVTRLPVNPQALCYVGDAAGSTTLCSNLAATSPTAALAGTTGLAAYYQAFYINANSTTVKGIELESHYKFKLGAWGSLRTSLDWSHMASYILDAGGTDYQLAGTHGPMIIGGNTANPKDRIQAGFDYAKDAIDVNTTFNWISGYTLTDPSGGYTHCNQGIGDYGSTQWFSVGSDGTANFPSNYCNVGSFMTVNTTGTYKFSKQLTMHFAVDNLFNRQPPTDLNTYGGTLFPYNPSMHQAGAIGRFFNAGVTYTF